MTLKCSTQKRLHRLTILRPRDLEVLPKMASEPPNLSRPIILPDYVCQSANYQDIFTTQHQHHHRYRPYPQKGSNRWKQRQLRQPLTASRTSSVYRLRACTRRWSCGENLFISIARTAASMIRWISNRRRIWYRLHRRNRKDNEMK